MPEASGHLVKAANVQSPPADPGSEVPVLLVEVVHGYWSHPVQAVTG